jgi:alpha-ribazole phosphatase
MFGNFQSTTIDLLRHGECEGGHVYRGSTDVALSETGWAQLRQQTGDFSQWEHIVTSPLQRCAHFASEAAQQRGVPLHVDPAFQEIHFGDWEGQLIADVWAEQGNHVRRFFADPVSAAPPNGEPMQTFETRVLAGWHTLINTHKGRHVLLVAHGGTIRVLLAHVLGMPLSRIANLEVPYASCSRVRVWHSQDEENTSPFAALLFHNSPFAR